MSVGKNDNHNRYVASSSVLIPEGYYYDNMMCTKDFNMSIYESAIKKIDIEGKYSDILATEFEEVNTASTYSNIRKYISNNISPYINNIIHTKEVIITPGMSIEDIRNNCVSNESFFDKLDECCKEIAKGINENKKEEIMSVATINRTIKSKKKLEIDKDESHECNQSKFFQILVSMIVDTLHNLPDKIKFVISKFETVEIVTGMFAPLHSVYINKSFIRSIMNIHNNIDKIMAENKYLEIDNSIIKKELKGAIKTSVILIEGKAFSPNKRMITSLIKYSLLDICNTYHRCNPKKLMYSYSLDPDRTLRHLGLYRLAVSLIKFDIKPFNIEYAKYECKNIIKSYIVQSFNYFMNKNEEKIKFKFKINNEMTVKQIKLAYTSNKEFFTELQKHCNAHVEYIKNLGHRIIGDIIPPDLRKKLSKQDKVYLIKAISDSLNLNISNLTEKIIAVIELLPPAYIVGNFFSPFNNIYVDNVSLLKAKSIFDSTQKEIDKTIHELAEKNCKDYDKDTIIRKLVEKQVAKLKEELIDPIMVIRNYTVSVANEKIRDMILGKLELDLMIRSLINN